VPSEDQRFPMRRGPGTDQRYGTMAATGPRPPDISGARRPASGLDQPGMAWSVKPSPRQSFEDRSIGCSPVRNQPIYRDLGCLLPHR
jgi:hypothetical protein